MNHALRNLVLTVSISASALLIAEAPYKGPSNQPQAAGHFQPQTVEDLHSVIVRLTTSGGNALCTAEYIGPTTLLSAAHCVEAVKERGGVYLGRELLQVLTVDGPRDVAVFRTSQRSVRYLAVAERNDKILFKPTFVAIGYGAGVFMISNPGMFFPENEVGLSIYNVNSNIGPSMGGMSGGTVMDMTNGKLVGIVQGGFTSGLLEGMGIFIPAPVIRDVLEAAGIELGK